MPYKLSNDTRNNVISLIQSGKSTHEIVLATGVSRSQVVRMKKDLNPNRVLPKGGRTSTVSERTKQTIARKIEKGEIVQAVDVQKYLWSLGHKLKYSSTTQLLRSLGFQSRHNKTNKTWQY